MAVFTPLRPPRGIGRDLPKETNADFAAGEGEELKLFPPSEVAPEARALYPFNKVTKYLDGSKIEFNTTPGTNYINLQTGDLAARLTMFKNGGIEIRQLGPIFYHEINNSIKTLKGVKPIHRTIVNDGTIETGSNKLTHLVDNLFKVVSKVSFFLTNRFSVISKEMSLRGSEIEIKGNSITIDAKNKLTITTGSLVINGDVEIFGSLKVNGSLIGEEGSPQSTATEVQSVQDDQSIINNLVPKQEDEVLDAVVGDLT